MFEHAVEGCQCEGKQCSKCTLTLCWKMFSPQAECKFGITSECRSCHQLRHLLGDEFPHKRYKRYRKKRDDKERFLSYVAVQENGCWLWIGGKHKSGYGKFTTNGKQWSAHRFSYEMYKEPIPKNMELDHLCRNYLCVNPEHVEAVTPIENRLRSMAYRSISIVSDAYPVTLPIELHSRIHRIPKVAWVELYRDLYQQVFGKDLSEAWIQDAEEKYNRIKGLKEQCP